ncbi:MAG: multicopper oxidase family protein [Deltaproteobacteria bacterium]
MFEVVADEAELMLVDGVGLRVWAYSAQVPGPTLRVRLGDRVQVKFTNRLPEPTTIHWHGVRVPNGMDGVPHVTQPPIEPGGTFVYDFTPKDAGTFWFHPHLRASEQVERGLYGVLIVDEPEPPPYAEDVVWVLHDWLLDEQRQIVGQFNTTHDLAHDGRWGNTITVNGRTDTTLRVRAGERIRLRIINSSNGRVYAPDLVGLGAKLIAVDGLYLREPIDPGRFEIAPGNRIDLDLFFESLESRRIPIIDRFYARSPKHLADILIDGIAPSAPKFASPARAHVPAWLEGLAVPPTMDFRLSARRGGRYGIEWTINGEAFTDHEHASPALTLSKGAWARLRFTNESARLHPIHLHGMFFKVLGRNGTAVDEPFFRDTVLIHAEEQIDIGVVPLDEGRWMVHCHILEHAEAGMVTLIDVRN